MKNQSIIAGLFLTLLFVVVVLFIGAGCARTPENLGNSQPKTDSVSTGITVPPPMAIRERFEMVVKSGASGLAGVTITVNQGEKSFVTNSYGSAELDELETGDVLNLSKQGYLPLKITLVNFQWLIKAEVNLKQSTNAADRKIIGKVYKGTSTIPETPLKEVTIQDYFDNNPTTLSDDFGAYALGSGLAKDQPNQIEYRIPGAVIRMILYGDQDEINLNVSMDDSKKLDSLTPVTGSN